MALCVCVEGKAKLALQACSDQSDRSVFRGFQASHQPPYTPIKQARGRTQTISFLAAPVLHRLLHLLPSFFHPTRIGEALSAQTLHHHHAVVLLD
jgi:hypothetical protein